MHGKEECFNHHKTVMTLLCGVQLSLCASEYFIGCNQAPISLTQFCGAAKSGFMLYTFLIHLL